MNVSRLIVVALRATHRINVKGHNLLHDTQHLAHLAYLGMVSVQAEHGYRYAAMVLLASTVIGSFVGPVAAIAAVEE